MKNKIIFALKGFLIYNLGKVLWRIILSNKSFLNIFPPAFFGIELTNTTRLIFLYGATYNHEQNTKVIYISINMKTRTKCIVWKDNWNINKNKKVQRKGTCLAIKSIISASPRELWGCLTTKARGTWPAFSSGYLLLNFEGYAFCSS